MKSPLEIAGALLPISGIVFWSFLSYAGDIISPMLNCHAHVLAAKKAGKARVVLLFWGSDSTELETLLSSEGLFKQHGISEIIKYSLVSTIEVMGSFLCFHSDFGMTIRPSTPRYCLRSPVPHIIYYLKNY